jgi:hypothetical protein
MLLLQSPSFKGFFENSEVFAEILKDLLEAVKSRDEGGAVDELQCKMVSQLCAETIIKHNLNPSQMCRCDLKIYIDSDNSKEVRQYFSLLKKDARKDIRARALDLKTSWLQNVFATIVTSKDDRQLWNELKTEFLAHATKQNEKDEK